jgi:hypothetical protein
MRAEQARVVRPCEELLPRMRISSQGIWHRCSRTSERPGTPHCVVEAELTARGIRTRRGGQWGVGNVRGVLERTRVVRAAVQYCERGTRTARPHLIYSFCRAALG